MINYQLWMRYAHFIYFLVIMGLLLVFVGPSIYGAKRWIDFSIFKVQPSEIAKWSTMILGASLLARSPVGDMRESLKGIFKVTCCFALPMFLIFFTTRFRLDHGISANCIFTFIRRPHAN